MSGTIAGWDVGNLAVGAEGTITVTASVISAPTRSLTTWAVVYGTTPDVDLSNSMLVDYRSAYLAAPAPGNFRLFLPMVRR